MDVDLPSVCHDDLLRDEKTETETLRPRLSGMRASAKGFENARQELRRDGAASVMDLENRRGFRASQADVDRRSTTVGDCVHQQVGDRLSHPIRVPRTMDFLLGVEP